MKKKVDSRIRTLIENNVKMNHRSFFVIIGDKAKDQIINLHYILTKSSVKPLPSVLWCYKKELGFSSNARKRMKQIKRDVSRGLKDSEQDPFELFVSSNKVRYTYYKDTHLILGQTFGMCILSDFEAITPNILARTIETVEGGGIVVLLLKTMTSLKQLYTMTMDVHDRFRTESHQDVVARFNERFLLSLSNCNNCLVVDDELNILPLSSHNRNIQPIVLVNEDTKSDTYLSPSALELKALQEEMKSTLPIGSLLECCRTLDQAKSLLTFADSISEKTLKSTVAMTAGRGRGKSSVLGLSLACAVAYGYANIYVTAPSPLNVGTLFELTLKGFDALEYKEHVDYEIVQATDPELRHAVVRINIFRAHRQTIQYIAPTDAAYLSQAELLVIDEAAAIPLPLVKKLMGPYLTFLSSTVNGYEGTGRSLSLKLIKEMRQNSASANPAAGGRVLREIDLKEPIRYGADDSVEKWLTDLLCLDCVGDQHRIIHGTPHPSQCELYCLNRDTLFSYHKASEAFLQRLMSLFVSSHYKNTPNDLQLLSDAPAHHIFVLLGPRKDSDGLPDILCALQVCLEGEISKQSVVNSTARGERAAGDLIPWTVSQQFQDNEFPQLSGARIVRIATHPDLNRMGYATRAIQLLADYYGGKIANLNENHMNEDEREDRNENEDANLLEETIKPRKHLKPLMEALSDRPPEMLQWIGTSYGLTQSLFNFWKKSGFSPVYLRQSSNDLTGEYTCIMLKAFSVRTELIPNTKWLDSFCDDFRRRFLTLLGYSFREFESILALSVLNPNPQLIVTDKNAYEKDASNPLAIKYEEIHTTFNDWDLKRLESYSKNLVDYHMILDLTPYLSRYFFLSRFTCSLSYTQCALLLAMGLQHKSVTEIEKEMSLPSNQILALFNRTIRKLSTYIRAVEEKEMESEMKSNTRQVELPKSAVKMSLNDELKHLSAKEEVRNREKYGKSTNETNQIISDLNLEDFAVGGTDEDWNKALSSGKKAPSIISIKNNEKSNDPKYQNQKKRDADLALIKAALSEKKKKANFSGTPKPSRD